MGKIPLITKEQQIILDEVKQNEFLRSQFYFTGGTALSAFYLHHRYSDDLDFFSQKRFDNQIIFNLMEEWGNKHGFTIKSRFVEIVYIFNLLFRDKTSLKVDFSYYPYKRMEKGTVVNNIDVDSLVDIAINKLLTISQRTEVKDFVDLFFLLQQYSLWDLVEGIRIKFKIAIEPFILGADLLKVEDFDYLPKMIKPLDLRELKSFFREKSKELGRQATI